MDETLTSIENDIRNERRDLTRNLEDLEHRARELANWRTHYRNHPFVALGLAAGAGLALAALVPQPRREPESHEYDPYHNASYGTPLRHRVRSFSPAAAIAKVDPHGHARRRLSEAWDEVIDSLAAVGTAAAIGLVSKYVPGFDAEYSTRRRGSEAI